MATFCQAALGPATIPGVAARVMMGGVFVRDTVLMVMSGPVTEALLRLFESTTVRVGVAVLVPMAVAAG